MAKRKEIEVDEDLIKSMMEGDVPRLTNMGNEEKEITVETIAKSEEAIGHSENKVESEFVQNKPRRRKESKDYTALFLKKGGSTKRQTYISAGLYDKVSKILGIIASEITVPNFIDNVLENHLKEYKEEINELYRKNADLQL